MYQVTSFTTYGNYYWYDALHLIICSCHLRGGVLIYSWLFFVSGFRNSNLKVSIHSNAAWCQYRSFSNSFISSSMISLGVFGLLTCYEVAYLDISLSMWVYIHSYAGWQWCCGFLNSHFFLFFLLCFHLAFLDCSPVVRWHDRISVCSIFLILCIHMIFPICLLPLRGCLFISKHPNSFIFLYISGSWSWS